MPLLGRAVAAGGGAGPHRSLPSGPPPCGCRSRSTPSTGSPRSRRPPTPVAAVCRWATPPRSSTLPDLDGNHVSFGQFSGRKRVLRHLGLVVRLPLRPAGLAGAARGPRTRRARRSFAVALDARRRCRPAVGRGRRSAADLPRGRRPLARDRRPGTGSLNVPTTVWVGEDDRIVKPPSIAPGDDRFRDFTDLDSSVHHDALPAMGARRAISPDLRDRTPPPPFAPTTSSSPLAEWRAAPAWLQQRGHDDAAAAHLARAAELAPWDWTVRRGGDRPARGRSLLRRGVPRLLGGVGRGRPARLRPRITCTRRASALGDHEGASPATSVCGARGASVATRRSAARAGGAAVEARATARRSGVAQPPRSRRTRRRRARRRAPSAPPPSPRTARRTAGRRAPAPRSA